MTNPSSLAFTKDSIGNYNSLTKREYYAGLAMQGFIASRDSSKKMSHDEISELPSNVASWAVAFADAIIERLNK